MSESKPESKSSPKSKKAPRMIKFEEAIAQLERIAEELEKGDLPLGDALARYEEGVKTLHVAKSLLTEAHANLREQVNHLESLWRETSPKRA